MNVGNETRLRYEERQYHNILVKEETSNTLLLASKYTEASELRRQELLTEALSSEVENAIDRTQSGRSEILHRESLESRAERDLWNLLDKLSNENLLDDINNEKCQSDLDKILSDIDKKPIYSNEDLINQLLQNDDRLKKGMLLKNWLESAAADKVITTQAPSNEPWSETYKNIKNIQDDPHSNVDDREDYIQGSDPDSQITKSGKFLRLDGTDMSDQELFLSSIWQLIRSGQLVAAQQLAYKQHMFWLASSLIGINEVSYNNVLQYYGHDDDDDKVVRVGDPKKPVWTRTCWKYAKVLSTEESNLKLSRAPVKSFAGNRNQMSTIAGAYELAIYAALSNNIQVMLMSPLITSWEDKIWVYIKALYENNVAKIIHHNRLSKKRHSNFYPGCDHEVIRAEEEIITNINQQTFGISIANIEKLFEKNETKLKYDETPNAKELIYLLQARVMQGGTAIKKCLGKEVKNFLELSNKSNFPGSSRILRVLCHFILWLKHTAPEFSGSHSIDIDNELLDLSAGLYIDHLILNKQRSLVAAYAKYLTRPLRIKKYKDLLKSIRTSSNDDEEKEMIRLAKLYFPNDVVDITKAVVEDARDKNAENVGMTMDTDNDRENIVNLTPARRSRKDKSMFSTINTPSTTAKKTSGGFSTIRRNNRAPEASDNEQFFSSTRFPITEEDIQRMESLKWLFIEPNHRIESLKQSNSIITSMLLNSKMKKIEAVRKLLDHYLPEDSIEVCKIVLEKLFNDAQTNQQPDMYRVSPPTREQEYISLIDQLLNPTDCKIRFWGSFVDAMNDYDTWKSEYENYNLERDRLLGSFDIVNASLSRLLPRLQTSAERATNSLLRTIQCDAHKDYEKYGQGMVKMFKDAQKAAFDFFSFAVKDCEQIPRRDGRNGREDVNCNDYKESIDGIESLLQQLDKKIIDQRIVANVEQLRKIVSKREYNEDDKALTESSLAICRQQLIDIRDGADILKLLIDFLFTNYLDICICTASSLVILKDQQQNAHYWYSKGIKIAELLASEEGGCRFYDEIDTTILEKLLKKINNLTIEMLKIVPTFQL